MLLKSHKDTSIVVSGYVFDSKSASRIGPEVNSSQRTRPRLRICSKRSTSIIVRVLAKELVHVFSRNFPGVSLRMKPSNKATLVPPSLSLSIKVENMDVAFVSAQLAKLKPITPHIRRETFQQVLHRLETLARLSSAVAQVIAPSFNRQQGSFTNLAESHPKCSVLIGSRDSTSTF